MVRLGVVPFRAVMAGALFVLPLLPLLAAPAQAHSIPWVAHYDYPDEICVEKGWPELGPISLVNGGPTDRTWTVRGSIRHTRSVYGIGQTATNNFLARIRIVMKDFGTGLVVAEAFDYHWSWNGPSDGAFTWEASLTAHISNNVMLDAYIHDGDDYALAHCFSLATDFGYWVD